MLSPNETQKYRPRISYSEYIELLNYIGLGLEAVTHVPRPAPIEFDTVKADKELKRFDEILDLDFDSSLVELSEGEAALLELEQALAGPPSY